MRAKIREGDLDWPGRVGEASPMETCPHEPPCLWVQFEDGEGGEYPVAALLLEGDA